MKLVSRVVRVLKDGDKRAWAAGMALAGAYIMARVLDRNGQQAHHNDRTQDPAWAQNGWAFWKHVLIRTYEEISDDHLLSLAGGVVFYALLALFPAITALVSSYALFADPSVITQHLATLKNVMPESAYSIIDQQITRVASITTGNLSIAFFVSFAIALWSANSGTKAIIEALNIVYEVKEARNFIWLNLVSLIFTVGTIIGLILAIAAVVAVPIVLSFLPLGGFGGTLVNWLRWPALLVLLMAGLAVLYRFGPNRENPRWQWLSPGAVAAAAAWLGGSAMLSWYLSNFANYGATYGSLGAAIGLMMWLWISAIVVLVGAELNAVIDIARDRPARERD